MRERLTALSRSLRRRETMAEERLWRELRNRQMDGWKFKRQAPRGPYVVDFVCFDASLIVEIDGAQHQAADQRIRDQTRTTFLQREGFSVLRFTNSDVLDNLDGALDAIYRALGERPAPSPGAPRWQRQFSTCKSARRPLPKGRGDAAASDLAACTLNARSRSGCE